MPMVVPMIVIVVMGMRVIMVVWVVMIMVVSMGVIVGMALCARGRHRHLLVSPLRRHAPDMAICSCYCWEV